MIIKVGLIILQSNISWDVLLQKLLFCKFLRYITSHVNRQMQFVNLSSSASAHQKLPFYTANRIPFHILHHLEIQL